MKYVLTGSQMQRCDKKTIEQFGVPSLVLMERAALSCVDELLKLPLGKGKSSNQCSVATCLERGMPVNILVVCGNGNNGGDGVAIARILAERGIASTLFFPGKVVAPERACSADCQKQLAIARAYGVEETDRETVYYQMEKQQYDVIVDAMFGVGLSRELDKAYQQIISRINRSGARVLAVDIPSGIHADNGKVMGMAVQADVTVTFGFYKRGHLLYPGKAYTNVCKVKDIGIPMQALADEDHSCICYERKDLDALPARSPWSNKGTYGKVLMIAGSREICGAAYFSGMAAYKTGCGLVQLMTEAANKQELQRMLPEALFTFYKQQEENSELQQQAELDRFQAFFDGKLSWATVVGIGPGLGQSADARMLLKMVLAQDKQPVVLDADALNLVAEDLGLLADCHAPVIVTPHMGEMSRLTGKSIQQLKEDPIKEAMEFARTFHVVCVLKDACTVVCDPEGQVYLNTSGNNGMSTGGSGDVLTGIICGLLAQHMAPFDAAKLGVFVHGCAGDRAAIEHGEYGVIARNLLKGIGEIINEK